MELRARQHADGVTFDVKVTPRAAKSRLKVIKEGVMHIALAAPPVDGKANEELIEFLSKFLSIPRSRISIIKGLRGRNKTVDIQGINSFTLSGHII